MAQGQKTGGRTKGTPNRATALRDKLDKLARGPKGTDLHVQKLHALSQSEDEHVAIKALTLMLAYRCGKPTESLEVSGADGGPVQVRFVGLDA